MCSKCITWVLILFADGAAAEGERGGGEEEVNPQPTFLTLHPTPKSYTLYPLPGALVHF